MSIVQGTAAGRKAAAANKRAATENKRPLPVASSVSLADSIEGTINGRPQRFTLETLAKSFKGGARPGKDGRNPVADVDFMSRESAVKMIKDIFDAIPMPADGEHGVDGESVKGEPGETPVAGKDYPNFVQIGEIIKEAVARIRVPVDGKTPVAGVDYVTADQAQDMLVGLVDEIPRPKDGTSPIAGRDYMTSTAAEAMIRDLVAAIPPAKDGKPGADGESIKGDTGEPGKKGEPGAMGESVRVYLEKDKGFAARAVSQIQDIRASQMIDWDLPVIFDPKLFEIKKRRIAVLVAGVYEISGQVRVQTSEKTSGYFCLAINGEDQPQYGIWRVASASKGQIHTHIHWIIGLGAKDSVGMRFRTDGNDDTTISILPGGSHMHMMRR